MFKLFYICKLVC